MAKYKQLMLMVPGLAKQEDKMDFYQALSSRGIYQTLNVARKMKEDSCENPEYIFSATALYMRQTAEIMHQAFPTSELIFQDNLYTANDKILLNFLTCLDDIFGCLLVLAEAQSIQKLMIQLLRQESNLIPSSCLCIRWAAKQSWKTIDKNTGQLVQLWIP